METYQSKIVALYAGHAHIGGIIAPEMTGRNIDIPIFIFPSVTCVSYNNPGFTSLKIDKTSGKMTKLRWHFFQLHYYLLFRVKTFGTVRPTWFGWDLNNVSKIREQTQKMS